jgi:hypothetical protein
MQTVDMKTVESAVSLSRREKLLRWAELVRQHMNSTRLLHGLEYYPAAQLRAEIHPDAGTAFNIAFADSVFKSVGLNGPATVQSAMHFFELSQDELHEFTCDCGGHISNERMAHRITTIAEGRS